ncbi:MAG: HesA/MoeB/ThiF family protein [Actinomycetota bacterium]|nr:HesA/MoeB/ThiF family protein [Actinomycetota bacterium]
MSELTDLERERYARQLDLPGWRQERLRDASAIVVGAGALGSPAALYLAAAGVGRIGVVDPAEVELGDLQRQPLHFTPDLTLPKAQNAAVKLRALNPEVQVEPYPARLVELNGEAIVAGADVVLDCTNDFESSRAVNDACCSARVPFVTGAVGGLGGFVLAVAPGETACHRCALPEDPGRATGALGALAGVVGSLQALEALKLLTGLGRAGGELIRIHDDGQTRTAVVPRDGCPSCTATRAPQSV